MWPSTRLLDLLGIELPIIQAPMGGGFATVELAAAVSEAGGLGSLGLSTASPEAVKAEIQRFRSLSQKPLNANFFCHDDQPSDKARHQAWHDQLAPYRTEAGLGADMPPPIPRPPFDATMCAVIEDVRPEVVSFHFGLPDSTLIARVKAAGCRVLASATTVAEACYLEERGVDAIVAQGYEAGGHRGMFLTRELASQPSTMALVPQVVDTVRIPVVAAGGIGDARGIIAALALGASGVQMGTAFLFCPEAGLSPLYRAALRTAEADQTIVANVFTGRPARVLRNRFVLEVGPIAEKAPFFPTASVHFQRLREAAEAQGSTDFTPLWAGQAARLGREIPAGQLIHLLATEARDLLVRLSGGGLPSEQPGE